MRVLFQRARLRIRILRRSVPRIRQPNYPLLGLFPSATPLSRNRMPKPGYYAVRIGRKPGIYWSWKDCDEQIKAYPGSRYKKFATLLEAQNFISEVEPSEIAAPSTSTTENINETNGKKRAIGQVEDESDWDVVYSDGACKGNGKIDPVAGLGVWWGRDDARNIAERCPGDQTNNRAELIAILRVLETTPLTKTSLLIKTDSIYSINCFDKWIHRWMRENWKTSNGQPVKNTGIIRCIWKNLEIRSKFGQKVRLQHVKGHSGQEGNEGADFLANEGTLLLPIPDRNWVALEKQLEESLSKLDTTADPQGHLVGDQESGGVPADTVSLEPQAGSHLPGQNEPEPPAKRSRTSHPISESEVGGMDPEIPVRSNIPDAKALAQASHSLGSQSFPSTVRVLYVAPPLVPVQAEDINPEDYADCLLDDDELAKELLG